MRHLILFAVLFIVACPPPPPVEHPTHLYDQSTCATATEHMQALGCLPAPNWKDVCTNAREHAIDLHVACRTAAIDCPAVKACGH